MPITYNVVGDLSALQQQTDPVRQKQLPFAISVALNRTAKDHVIPAARREMQVVFDRPTAYTLNSLRQENATKSKLVVSVGFKGEFSDAKGHYLWPEIDGGPRVTKRFEKMLSNLSILPEGMFAVPGQGAKLDSSGNMSAGQIIQILSQVRAQEFEGFESRIGGKTFNKKKIAAAVRRQGYRIFVVKERTERLLPGIYARYNFAHGTAVKPLLIFVPRPQYRKRFDFFGVSQKNAEAAFPAEFDKAMAEAIATAR